MALLVTGSIPDVGSSKKTIFDFPIKAIPRLSFLLLPPLSCLESLFFSVYRQHLVKIQSISYSSSIPENPFILPQYLKCSSTLRSSQRTSLQTHIPVYYLILSRLLSMESPQNFTDPESFEIRPVTKLIVVVLPAPLWPKIHNN